MVDRCILAVGLLLVGLAAGAHGESPPNVLLIVSDDQCWTDYGFMGHPRIRTPHLDALAAESAVFPRGYVPMSLCRPSLATLITGLYPHQHGIPGNDPRFTRQPDVKQLENQEYLRLNRRYIDRFAGLATLPRLLARKGYVSLQTGKWWEGSYENGGFTAGMTHGDPARGGRHGDAGLAIGRQDLQPIYEFIDAHHDKPWFIWYAPMMPHLPHNPPERLIEHYRDDATSLHVTRYFASCEWFDETCGALLDFLRQRDLEQNTLVVYVTDNGWLQDPNSPRFAPRSKRSPYDGGLRTPVLLRWPGHISPARYERTLVSSIDIVPTILSAAGVRVPENLAGLDLIPVCRNAGETERDAVFGEVYDHDMPDFDNPVAGLQYRWVVAGEWKLIRPVDSAQPPELYHITKDPTELRNLAAERPELAAQLQQRLDEWWNPTTP